MQDKTPFPEIPFVLPGCELTPLGERSCESVSAVLAFMDPWRSMGYRPEGLLRYLLREDPALRRYEVLVSDSSAGVLCLRYPWLLGPFIELIALYDRYKGAGLGGRLIGWIEERSRPVSQNIWATVSSFNTGARRFYQRTGFEETALLSDLIKTGYDEILIRKRLTHTGS